MQAERYIAAADIGDLQGRSERRQGGWREHPDHLVQGSAFRRHTLQRGVQPHPRGGASQGSDPGSREGAEHQDSAARGRPSQVQHPTGDGKRPDEAQRPRLLHHAGGDQLPEEHSDRLISPRERGQGGDLRRGGPVVLSRRDLVCACENDVVGVAAESIEGHFKIFIGNKKAVHDIDRTSTRSGSPRPGSCSCPAPWLRPCSPTPRRRTESRWWRWGPELPP